MKRKNAEAIRENARRLQSTNNAREAEMLASRLSQLARDRREADRRPTRVRERGTQSTRHIGEVKWGMTETPETHTTGSFNLKPIIHADLPSVQLQRDYEALAATAARSAARVAAQRRALTQIRDMATERQREGSTFAGLRHIRVLAEAALAEEETAEEDAPGIPSEVRAGYYRHYKGQYYLLFGLAHHSETMKLMAVYVALYLASGPRMAVRPAELFFDEVCLAEGHLPNHVGRPSNADCKMAPRFVYVGLEVPAESVAG